MRTVLSCIKRYRALIVATLLVLWVGHAFYAVQNVVFETNDDSSMAKLAYGMIGYYETHLVFINVFIGQCLKAALTVFPNLPWYSIFQCTLVFLSFFSFVYLIFKRFGIRKGLLPNALLILFFGAQFFLNIQFSKTAGICTIAGLLLLFDAVDPKNQFRIWKLLPGAFLTVMGSMYRFKSFCMMLIPFFGIGLSMIGPPLRNKDWKQLLRICVPFVAVLAVCFLMSGYDKLSYKLDPQWAAYREFNGLRAQLLDYGFPNYEENKALYASLGITEADISLFKRWDFADSEIFTLEAIRQLVAAKTPEPLVPETCIRSIVDFFFNYRYSAAIWVALAISALTAEKKNVRLLAYFVFSTVGILLYLYISGRYGKNRVDSVISCALFLLPILYSADYSLTPKAPLALFLAVFLAATPFAEYVPEENTEEMQPIVYHQLVESDKEHLYVTTTLNDVERIPRPTEIYPVGYTSNTCSLGGWNTNILPYQQVLKQYGVTNLYRDLVDNPKLYFSAPKDMSQRINYIRRHYAPTAEACLVKVTEDGHSIYRVSSTGLPVVDTAKSVDGIAEQNIHVSVSATVEKKLTVLTGYLYQDGMNSFASNIYCGLTDTEGMQTVYFTQQSYSDTFPDLEHGQYGTFTVTLPKNHDPESSLQLYLEVNGKLYRLDMGSVSQLFPEAE